MMFFNLASFAAIIHLVAFATPIESEEKPELWERQDEDIEVDAPGNTPLDLVEPVNIDPLTDVHNSRLIGDLVHGATTPVGNTVLNILLGKEKAESKSDVYRAPGSLNSKACQADKCTCSLPHTRSMEINLTFFTQAACGPTYPIP